MMMHSPNYFTVPLKAFHEITSKVLQTNFMKEKVSKSSFVSSIFATKKLIPKYHWDLNTRARKAPNTKLECVGLLFCAQILLRSKKTKNRSCYSSINLTKAIIISTKPIFVQSSCFFKFQVLKIETHQSLKLLN